MALRVPDRVREVWGDEMVVELGPWLQEFIREYGVPRDEYRELLSRLDALGKDISLIKEEMSGSRAELTQMAAGLRAEMGQVRAGFRDELGQMRAAFREDGTQMRAQFSDGQAQIRAEFREDLDKLRRETHDRFDRVNERFDEMGARFEGRFDEMNERILVQTRWMIGSLAVIGTVISVLLAIAQFTP